jgi:tRNA U34 5-methylaminomethyl-2-thiouridine-forming methyltransferase MnmC
MDMELRLTLDGSFTVYSNDFCSAYHSTNGALQESMHVFIEAGLKPLIEAKRLSSISVFEMGFGSGLNALLTLQMAESFGIPILYTAIETHPLDSMIAQHLTKDNKLWEEILKTPWNETQQISPCFSLKKIYISFEEYKATDTFDLIYYDAFDPAVQPELWTLHLFKKLYTLSNPQAVFVTYCAKGQVRRDLQAAGFSMERLPGPPGKRHILRGVVG